MIVKKTNARRFISSYNNIDNALRAQYNYKRSLPFSDVLKKSVPMNSIVRKYEDELIDYSRLRNAIVHGGDEDNPIAEPHIEVVNKIEYIEKLITTSPRALDYFKKDVITLSPNCSLKSAINLMAKNGFANLPVYENVGKNGKNLLGIVNAQKLIEVIGNTMYNVDEFLENTNLGEFLEVANSKYYDVVPSNISLQEILDRFYKNRKLLVIIITEEGKETGNPLGIVTVGDIMDINNTLDNY